jgi:hypothetical protein
MFHGLQRRLTGLSAGKFMESEGSEAGGATVAQPAACRLGGIHNPIDAPQRSDRLRQ